MGIKYIKAEWAGYMDVNYESGRMKSYCIDAIPKTVQTWLDKHPKEAASVYGGMLDALSGWVRTEPAMMPIVRRLEKSILPRCVDNPYFAQREVVDILLDGFGFLEVIDSLGGAVRMCIHNVDDKVIAWLDEHVDKATKLYEDYKKEAEWQCEYWLEHDLPILSGTCKDLWFITDQEAKIERRRQEEEV